MILGKSFGRIWNVFRELLLVCGLVQALQHGHSRVSGGGEGVLFELRHPEAQEEHPFINI